MVTEIDNNCEAADNAEDNRSLVTQVSDETLDANLKIFNIPASQYSIFRELPIASAIFNPGVMLFSSMASLGAYVRKNKDSFKDKDGLKAKDGSKDEDGSKGKNGLKGKIGSKGKAGLKAIDGLKGKDDSKGKDGSDYQRDDTPNKNLGVPILLTSNPMLNLFMRNSPFLVIYKYNDKHEKSVFCKAYFRVLANNLTSNVLYFSLNDGSTKMVTLLINGISPSVDLILDSTKIRITGVTGTTSTFANGLIQLYIMKNSCPSLADGLNLHGQVDPANHSLKNIKVEVDSSNELYNSLVKQERPKLKRLVSEGENLFHLPFASFVDTGDRKLKGLSVCQNGVLRLFSTNDNPTVCDDTLILCCIILVLREQEFRKNKGNKKPALVYND